MSGDFYELAGNMRLRGKYVDTVLDLLQWCRDFNQFNKYPVPTERRFGIGVYQIYQGMKWDNRTPAKAAEHESFAAACLHFMMTAELLSAPVEQYLPKLISEISRPDIYGDYYKQLLRNIGKAQQMVVYFMTAHAKRKSRFDANRAAAAIAETVKLLMGVIPEDKRQEAIFNAMEVMTGAL